MSYKVLTDGNSSGFIRVIGLGDYMPLKDHQAMVKECENARDALAAVMAECDALAAQVKQLEEEVFRLHCFDIDVIRCLKTIAFEHNHSDMALYQELAKKCINDIASRKPLCEIRAEAGRSGFIAGINLRSKGSCNDWDGAANEYAESIRKGGAK